MTANKIGKGMWAISWLLLLGLLYYYFEGELNARYNPNKGLTNTPSAKVVLKMNRYGHYIAPGKINGVAVTFLLDTGATSISIPSSIAKDIGLTAGATRQVETANGIINVYSTELNRVQLGGITRYNIRGHINPHMDSSTVLLGMSFMRDLEMTQKGDLLTLKL